MALNGPDGTPSIISFQIDAMRRASRAGLRRMDTGIRS